MLGAIIIQSGKMTTIFFGKLRNKVISQQALSLNRDVHAGYFSQTLTALVLFPPSQAA